VVDGVVEELGTLVEGTWVVDGVIVGLLLLADEDDADVVGVLEEDGLVVEGVRTGDDVVEGTSDVEAELDEVNPLVEGVPDDEG